MKRLFSDKGYLYLKLIYFIRYFGDSLFYGFTSLYLSNIGFKEGIIGTIQSITTITTLIANPIFSIFARNNKIARILMFILSIIEGTFIIIYGNLDTLELIMVLTSLLAIAASPFYTLLDGYSASYCTNNNKEFPSIRVMGSIAYVFGTFFGGMLIDSIGYTYVFLIAGILFVITGVLISFLKNVSTLDTDSLEKKSNFKEIFSNKKYLFYLLSYLLIVSISVIGDNFISLYFTKVHNMTVTNYSYVFTCILVAEVITICLLTKIGKKFELSKLLIIAGLIYSIRSFLISFTSLPIVIIIIAACLRGVAWGLILYIHMKYIIKLVGIINATTAALIISICGSILTFILNNVVGYFIEYYGYSIFYLIISIIVLCMTIVNLIHLILINIKKKKDVMLIDE